MSPPCALQSRPANLVNVYQQIVGVVMRSCGLFHTVFSSDTRRSHKSQPRTLVDVIKSQPRDNAGVKYKSQPVNEQCPKADGNV
jgi:hypothetical protein